MEDINQPPNPPFVPQNVPVSSPQPSMPALKPAGAWVRFWAGVIDGFILSIPYLILIFIFSLFDPKTLLILKSGNGGSDGFGYIIVGLFIIVITFAYSVYLTVNKGATWGKDAYGLRVVKYGSTDNISYGKAILRELVKTGIVIVPIIGGLISFINVLMVIFSSEKRGIHDRIAGTQVIKAKNRWSIRKQLVIFSLIILLLFITIYGGIFLVAKNIGQRFPKQSITPVDPFRLNSVTHANDTKRRNDTNAIINAIYQYAADNKGIVPDIITASKQEISKSQVDLCSFLVSKYIIAIPVDPVVNNGMAITDCTSSYSTGYNIIKDRSTGKVTVSAPNAELGSEISSTR